MDKNVKLVGAVVVVVVILAWFFLSQGPPKLGEGQLGECFTRPVDPAQGGMYPTGKLCTANEECETYVQAIRPYIASRWPELDASSSECRATTFTGTDYSCASADDCIAIFGVVSEAPDEMVQELRRAFPCRNSKCQMTEGLYDLLILSYGMGDGSGRLV